MYDKSLNDFLRIIQSPEAYPQFVGNAFLQTGVLKFVGSMLMVVGIIGFVFMVIKFAADVLVMTGVLYIIDGFENDKISGAVGGVKASVLAVSSYTDDEAREAPQHPLEYFKEKFWKNILLLILIIMLSSGLFLPIVASGTALGGGIVAKVLSINPVEYLKYVKVAPQDLEKTFNRLKDNTAIKQYNDYVKQASIALDVATSENSDAEIASAATDAYRANFDLAKKMSEEIERRKELLRDKFANGKPLTKEDENLLNFNSKLHEQYFNEIKYNKGTPVTPRTTSP